MKKDIICGYPNPTKEQILQFQINNHREADGIIGPNTRSAIWRPRGHRNVYTHLIDYPLQYDGDKEFSKDYFKTYLLARLDLVLKTGLPPIALVDIATLLTSQWKTGLTYLSTQDGITLGMRRLATVTLQGFLRENYHLRTFFTKKQWKQLLTEAKTPRTKRDRDEEGAIPDVNNGFPLDEEDLRIRFLNLVQSKECWRAQIEEMLIFIAEMVGVTGWYPQYKDARLIALICRAANSSKYRYCRRLPKNEKRAYRKLKKRYSDTGTHRRRIERLEELIPEGTEWR